MAIVRNAALLRQIMDARLADVHTSMPGQVKAFDASAQTITAQPLLKHVFQDADGNELEESYPEIRNVPILYPRAGGFVVAWPLAVGDPVLILFSEWALGLYRETGKETHPADLSRHGFAGAMALPVGPAKASDTIGETIDGLVIGYDGGGVIRIANDGTIRVGSSGGTVQPVALGDDVETQLNVLASDINALKTAIGAWVPVPNDGGAALKAVLTTWFGSSVSISEVGSSKVDVEE